MKNTNYMKVLKQSRLFSGLGDLEKEELFKNVKITPRKYRRGEIIVREGDIFKNILIIVSGNISGQKFDVEGEVSFLNIYEPGEVVCLEIFSSSEKTAPVTYSAAKACEVLIVPPYKMLYSKNGKVIMENIINLLSDENIKQMYKIEILAKKSLRQRILAYLFIMQKKKNSNPFEILMTQEQMAQYLCVNRSALSLELNKMRREGIIQFKKTTFKLNISEKEMQRL